MKPHVPQRPTSSVLSPGAILASLRANNITPTSHMSRAVSVPRRLISKTESIEPKGNVMLTPQHAMKEIVADKQETEETSVFSLEAPRIGLGEVRKGILIKRRERFNALGNSLNKTTGTTEENRRSSVIRLFANSKDNTPVNKEERYRKSRQHVRTAQDLLEETRPNENLLDYSTESKKNKKVTFTFTSESAEVSGSSVARKVGMGNKNNFFTEKEANFVAKNRAFRLIAETSGPGPKLVSDGANFVNGYDINLSVKTREIKHAVKENNIKKINMSIPVNNSLPSEALIDLENKEAILDLNHHEIGKIGTIRRFPLIPNPTPKTNIEVLSGASVDKGSLTMKREESSQTFDESPKNKHALVHSSSLSVLGERKGGKGHYNYNLDKLKKKDDNYFSVNESRLKMGIQHNLSLNKGWKLIDPEQTLMDAREEYRKKIFHY